MAILLPIPGDENMSRAYEVFESILAKTGDGMHTLTINTVGLGGTASRRFHFAQENKTGSFVADVEMGHLLCELLAVAVKGENPSGLVLRTWGIKDRVCGWKFEDGTPIPLTKGELFNAYCYNPETGEMGGPSADAEFTESPDIA
ncbi:hypothetical protein ACIBCC_37100 [Streptomyces griseus]|uniref:hypothetical protein n=1 Tax=Streptomyces griseus TaxID=1911 RepID=UPI0037BE1CF4